MRSIVGLRIDFAFARLEWMEEWIEEKSIELSNDEEDANCQLLVILFIHFLIGLAKVSYYYCCWLARMSCFSRLNKAPKSLATQFRA